MNMKVIKLFGQGNYVLAEKVLRDSEPNDENLGFLSEALIAQKKYREAIDILKVLITRYPESFHSYMKVSISYMELGDKKNYEKFATKALDFYPTAVPTLAIVQIKFFSLLNRTNLFDFNSEITELQKRSVIASEMVWKEEFDRYLAEKSSSTS